jgi:hypothetical protein
MAEEEHAAPKGFFGGTIFEGGLFGGSQDDHGHEKHPVGSYEYLAHNTKLGKFLFDYMAEWGVSRALSLWIIFLGLFFILGAEIPHVGSFAIEWLFGLAPIWLPVFAVLASWAAWVWYVQGLYISGRDPVVLDIKIPREITKSPRAMELALVSMYNTSGEGSFLHRIWHGQVRVWFSLEYVSIGGEVHMFIWCWKNYRHVVESALYAQFPEIEIHQTEDYASKFRFDPEKHKAFCNDHAYPKSDAFPLKTYIEFELDKDPDEEFKIDPMAQAFEYLSSLRTGEQAWIQVIFRATGKQGSLFNPTNGVKAWTKRVEQEVDAIRKDASKSLWDPESKKDSFPHPTWVQTEQVRIMQRQIGKIPFDVAVRGIYIGENSVYNGASGNGTRWFWKPINNPGYLNALEPTRGHNPFDFPWQDFMGYRQERLIPRRYIDAYRRRSAFHAPWTMPYHVMTNEVLATMFHFPSSSIEAPGLERISAKKAEPPHNLPK